MTDSFIDPRTASYSKLSEVEGPAYFVPFGRPEDAMFVTAGEQPAAVLLNGKWRGESFKLDTAEDWQGIAVTSVDIEVDITSAYAPDDDGKTPLSVIRRGTALGIMATSKSGSFGQTLTRQIEGEDDPQGTRLGFRRWKIVQHQGLHTIVLAEVDARPAS